MQRETSSLLIKSNRILGTRLVEADLTNLEDMDKANEVFIERARAKDLKRSSLLRILIFDHQTLREESLIDYQIEQLGIGAVMTENYNIDEVLLDQQPLEFMRASWTIPVDFVNDRWFLATAYYMSDVVRKFWEDRLEGRITWYVSPLSQMEMILERLEKKEADARDEAEAAAKTNVAEKETQAKTEE